MYAYVNVRISELCYGRVARVALGAGALIAPRVPHHIINLESMCFNNKHYVCI